MIQLVAAPEEGRGGGALTERGDVCLRRGAQHDGGQLVGLGEEVKRGGGERASAQRSSGHHRAHQPVHLRPGDDGDGKRRRFASVNNRTNQGAETQAASMPVTNERVLAGEVARVFGAETFCPH